MKICFTDLSSFPNIFTLERNWTSKKQEEQSINIHFNLSWVFKASCTQNIESGFITFNLFAYILCRSQFKFSESISARRLSIETQFIPQVTKQRSNKHVLLITKLVAGNTWRYRGLIKLNFCANSTIFSRGRNGRASMINFLWLNLA